MKASAARPALLACALALAWAASVAGAPLGGSSARLEASLGFGGYTAPGRWVPLRILREGGPEEATALVVRSAADGRELGGESFPLPSGLRIECPVPIADELETVSVRLLSDRAVLAEAKLGARAKTFPGHIVLACSIGARSRLAVAAALLPAEPLQAIAVGPGDLPSNGLDYDSVSALAIGDDSLRLSPAQAAALLAWVSGGGTLALGPAGPGSPAFLESLGLGSAGEAADAEGIAARSLGLGRIVRLTRDPGDLPLASGAALWRKALALAPYGERSRLSASSLAKASSPEGRSDPAALTARAAMVAAVAAWLAALLGAAALSRDKSGSAWPMASVSCVFLALILAGGPSLDRALMRGASARALALVLPESGSVILRASFKEPAVSPEMEWTAVRALLPLPVAGSDGDEARSPETDPRGNPRWTHRAPKARFSLLASSRGGLELSGLLPPRSLAGSTFPARFPDSRSRGSGEPPELVSSGPMAYLGEGAGNRWERRPGGAWERIAEPPAWLEGDEAWLQALRRGIGARALLVGFGEAPSLGLEVAGAPLRDFVWALPLLEGRP